MLVGLVQSGPMPQGITTSNDDPTLLSNPNLVIHYTSKENLDRLTTHLNLKENVSGDPLFWDTVFFHLWTPETTPDNPVKLMAHQVNINSQNNILLWGFHKAHRRLQHIALVQYAAGNLNYGIEICW